MPNTQYQKGKIRLEYSKNAVKKAGEHIRKSTNMEESTAIIQNYRAAHLYPLTIIRNLVWKHVCRVAPKDAIVARRLKRLPTIINKLQRRTLDGVTTNAICITRMQDIGGCRVIVKNREQLIQLNNSLAQSHTVHDTKEVKDYATNPKPTGYRGIHRVYKCYQKAECHDWKGFFIELQLRTMLQHLWATTVEIVDLCERTNLKTNPFSADIEWFNFFKFMSDFFADEEGFLSLSNQQKNDLKSELLKLDKSLKAIEKLKSFNKTFSDAQLEHAKKKYKYAIIIVSANDKEVVYSLYEENQKNEALETYSKIEREKEMNCLLVNMDDMRKLKYAYPNYLIDTDQFINKFETYTKSNDYVTPTPPYLNGSQSTSNVVTVASSAAEN